MKLAFFFEIKRCVSFCDFQSELSWEELQSNSVPLELHLSRATAPCVQKASQFVKLFYFVEVLKCVSPTPIISFLLYSIPPQQIILNDHELP